jgi:hypothetical protein
MTDTNAEWVPKGEEADPPYEPPPIDEEIAPEQASDEGIPEGLENIPTREEIITSLDAFREPFAQTHRRKLAAEIWPEYESEIWSGVWQTPSPDDVDPETGKLTDGVRWSDNAGCPVHVQATSQQERYIAEQAINNANAAVDSIVQRYEEVLDDANYENSLLTARRMRTAKQMLAAFSRNGADPGGFSQSLNFEQSFHSLDELFESEWIGDEASRKGQKYFGGSTIRNGSAHQWTMADALLMSAVDDIRAQATLYVTLGQIVYDTYVVMSEKTHLSIDIGVLQGLADTLSTVGVFLGKAMPGSANVVGWAASMLTKKGDFVITVSFDQVASSDDIDAWTDDLTQAVADAEDEIKGLREELEKTHKATPPCPSASITFPAKAIRMSKNFNLTKSVLWLGPAALVIFLLATCMISGDLRTTLEPPHLKESSEWPRAFSEKNYYETLSEIIVWDDFCGTAMIDELVSSAGEDPARASERTDVIPDHGLLEERSSDFIRSCTVLTESRDCGGLHERDLTVFDQFQIDLTPHLSEAEAASAYDSHVTALADLPGAADMIAVDTPWRDGAATYHTRDDEVRTVAVALGDFYTVGVFVSRADPNCDPQAAELTQAIAETFLPALHASIEERLASEE